MYWCERGATIPVMPGKVRKAIVRWVVVADVVNVWIVTSACNGERMTLFGEEEMDVRRGRRWMSLVDDDETKD